MNATPTEVPAKRKSSRLAIVIAVLAVIILAVLALPLFINADARRPEIEAELSRATGRKVTLGKIQFRVFPAPSVVIDDARIGNSTDSSAGNVVVADEIRARVSWSALLRDKFLVTAIDVDHAIFTLEKYPDGGGNYIFSAPVKDSAAPSGAASSGAKLFELSPAASINFSNAEATYSEIWILRQSPLGILAAHNLNFQVSDFIAHAGDPAAWEIHAKLDGLRLELAALSAPIAFSSGEATLTHGALDARFHAQAATIADIKGTFRIADVSRGTTSFEISTPAFDARALLAALRNLSAAASAAINSQLDATVAPSSDLLASGRITADRVDWAPYAGGNASAEIRFYSDHTEVWPASVTLYGGTVDFTARTDARQHPERFSANFQLRTLDLSRLLTQAPSGLRGKISGLADVDLELLGSVGGAWRQMLTGNGHFSIRNGKLPGPHIGGTLGHLANAAGLNEIPFKQISADVSIATGRANISQGAVDASLVTAIFSGGFSLTDQSLDLAGIAKFSPDRLNTPAIRALLGSMLQSKAASATLPFTLSGTVSDPVFASGRAATPPVHR